MNMDMDGGYDKERGVYSSLFPPAAIPTHPHENLVSFLFAGPFGKPENASKLALVNSSNPAEHLTFDELKKSILSVGSGLWSLGLRQGDVVMILVNNSIYFPPLFFGILSIGAIVSTMNPSSTSKEIQQQLEDCKARMIVTTPDLLSKLSSDAKQLPLVVMESFQTVPQGINFTAFEMLLAAPFNKNLYEKVRIRQGDTAALLYSSGTTGRSKGVILSHGNFIAAVAALLQLGAAESDDVGMILLPQFHVAGLVWSCCRRLYQAVTLIVLPKFDILALLQAIQHFRVTDLPMVPPIVVALMKHPKLQDFDLSSLRTAGSGAAPLAKDSIDTFLTRLPHIQQFSQGYGMTETTGTGNGGPSPLGSAGRLMSSFEGKVIDIENGNHLPPNQRGELCLRGPAIMQGYLNNPVTTAETVDAEGWLHTGDIVYFDNDGYMYVVDRLKELIKYKGFQVAPAELEAVLLTHPYIKDCAVIPYKNEEAGEIPMAYVVTDSGCNLSEKEVMEFVEKQVASFKKIRKVAFIGTIPKSPSGKILRKDLVNLSTANPSKL